MQHSKLQYLLPSDSIILTDKDLIEAIAKDDQMIITTFFEQRVSKIFSIFSKRNFDHDSARIIAVESYYRLLQSLNNKVKIKKNAEAIWVGIANNVAKETRRSNRSLGNELQYTYEIANEETTYQDSERDKILSDLIERNLSLAGHECKDVLYRFYILNQSISKIAKAINKKIATVRQIKKRCLEKIRPNINPEDYRWIFEI